MKVLLEVVEGDLSTIEVDVIALKHATGKLYGVEKWIDRKLDGLLSLTYSDNQLESAGTATIINVSEIGTKQILVVGIGPLYELTYRGVDRLARDTIESLVRLAQDTKTIATTVHGPGIGLDEEECFKTQIFGFASALGRLTSNISLNRIKIVERDAERAVKLSEILTKLSSENPELIIQQGDYYVLRGRSNSAKIEEIRYSTLNEPTIFVAMPFSKAFRNVYDYGIRLPIMAVGRKPVRIDDEHFTGPVIEQVKNRIQSSEIVIADMTTSNPNVFYEVGFAEGLGKRAILLCQDITCLPFDVKGNVHIVYDPENLRVLEENLTIHLKAIINQAS